MNDKSASSKGEAGVSRVDFGEVEVYVRQIGRPEDRVRHHLEKARAHGRICLAHLIAAGWELYIVKSRMRHGEWGAWCRDCLRFSKDTADRYIEFFRRTVGAARDADGLPLADCVTQRELDFATADMEDKSATQMMIELGIVRRNPNHGGAREGAGRPPAEADPAKDATRVWAVAADAFRRIPETSYRFLPLDEARGVLGELDAVRARLRARIRELTDAGKGAF